MMELSFNNVMKYLDATLVLKNISFNVYDNEGVGIVGVNGSGKSTILKIIAGIEEITSYDSGTVAIPRGKTIGYLEQVPRDYGEYKVKDILNVAFQELKIIETSMKNLEEEMKNLRGEELERALQRYSIVQQEYEIKGGYEKEEKLSKVCTGLNFSQEFLNKDFQVLSGGEKTTVGLGKILLENPDILLLDEPTNHLDMESTEWLEAYLKSYKGMVIIVSHDRYFLDNVVTKIIEIEDMISETYKGNYSEFVKQKEENMLLQFHQFKEQQKQIKAMENTIKELREWAVRADNKKFFKRAASIQKKLDKMKKIEKPKFEKEGMKINFKDGDRSGNRVVFAENLGKSYGNKILLKNSNLLINFREMVAIIGANGSGKTTFLKMLLKEEKPDEGLVSLGESIKVAYLPQNIIFSNEEATALEYFREDINILEGKAREYLSKFMFFGGNVFKKVKHLSGGERVRLKLSKLLYQDVNLLILDEPTNHLDIEAIEELENALAYFNGTLIFISHDRYFINKMSSRIIAIEDNRFVNYHGNYEYYKSEKEKRKNEIIDKKNITKEKVIKVKVEDENKKLEKEIEKLELNISKLEEEIKDIDMKMNSATEDYNELNALYIEKEKLKEQLDVDIEKWNTLMERIK